MSYGNNGYNPYGAAQPNPYANQAPYGQTQAPYNNTQNQYNGYGQSPAPTQEPTQPYDNYNAPNPYAQQNSYAPANNNHNNSDIEMANLPTDSQNSSNDSVADAVNAIGRKISSIESNMTQIKQLQNKVLNDANASSSSSNPELESLSNETMRLFETATADVKELFADKRSGYPMNIQIVDRVKRRLQEVNQEYQKQDVAYRRAVREQFGRQLRIISPDITDAEITEAIQSNDGQHFRQALMMSNQQGMARAALTKVKDRQATLLRIEQQMAELAELFTQLNSMVIEQREQVEDVQHKVQNAVTNLHDGNVEVQGAVQSTIKRQKKKWWCVGILVTVILIVVIVIAVYFAVNRRSDNNDNNNNNNDNSNSAATKRSEEPVAILKSILARRSNIRYPAVLDNETIQMIQGGQS